MFRNGRWTTPSVSRLTCGVSVGRLQSRSKIGFRACAGAAAPQPKASVFGRMVVNAPGKASVQHDKWKANQSLAPAELDGGSGRATKGTISLHPPN